MTVTIPLYHLYYDLKVKVKAFQSCLTLFDPMDIVHEYRRG